jgi:oxalate decarboxylase/phosphoglucose isomerase-like protein (cupin superfamily)
VTDANETLPTVLDSYEVASREWAPFPGSDHVQYKLLWTSGWSVAGVMRVAANATLESHVHDGAHHHIWVIEGSAEMLGERVDPGSYVHVPPGVRHGIENVGPSGFSMLYLYLREDRAGTA